MPKRCGSGSRVNVPAALRRARAGAPGPLRRARASAPWCALPLVLGLVAGCSPAEPQSRAD
ncbi:hypothetical protein PU560_03330, partial [Georgenia sp. 10Sc9-8]|nr:hypothetical protein [Georgenia halotolerans]